VRAVLPELVKLDLQLDETVDGVHGQSPFCIGEVG
jgi:hypothetical protein